MAFALPQQQKPLLGVRLLRGTLRSRPAMKIGGAASFGRALRILRAGRSTLPVGVFEKTAEKLLSYNKFIPSGLGI